ncbi:MAG: anaerobic ribonucleoside-triphosphate reductase activating protein [Candidatus Marsarchaeota archaeon]|nr:anaerobic ribonucleoside-triphosphate reductase activating protein [Candidatus Marsarchaeota archaeon]
MEICGFQRVSLIDYPGKVASIVFVAGCNMRCPFCHNSDLALKNYSKLHVYKQETILRKLHDASRFLDGVEITGGEPTLQADLADFMSECKAMGLLVKLDTNGSNPGKLRELLERKIVDYVAMDVKTAPDAGKYTKAAGVGSAAMFKNINESIDLLLNSGIDYEFRTTVVPGLVSAEDLKSIAHRIKGAKAYYLQQYVAHNTLDPSYEKVLPYSDKVLQDACNEIRQEGLVMSCGIRG